MGAWTNRQDLYREFVTECHHDTYLVKKQMTSHEDGQLNLIGETHLSGRWNHHKKGQINWKSGRMKQKGRSIMLGFCLDFVIWMPYTYSNGTDNPS